MKNSKAKVGTKTVTVPPEPKPQIPAMMQSLRRQGEAARGLIDALEAKLGPVLRPDGMQPVRLAECAQGAAPLAEQLTETISVMSVLNSRLRDITARLEL